MAEESHGYVKGVGGLRLFYRAWEIRDPRATVLLVHGLGEHSGRYEGVARALNAAGFSAYGLDLRGHGRSQGRRGHVRAFEHLLQDVDRLRRRVCSYDAVHCPTFLLGQSLGGLVTLRYLQEYGCPSLRGAVAVAPFIRLTMEVPAWKFRFGRLADRLAPAITLDNELRPEVLFREDAEREAYRSDPLVHRRISARLWAEMLRNAKRLVDREQRIGVPVLFQLPGTDLVVDSAASEALSDRISTSCDVRVYSEAYHDLYHDPEAEHGLSDAASWLCSQVVPTSA
ncbi:MAG: alpha/beta hydrolase [Gemmatimonadota bacterium]